MDQKYEIWHRLHTAEGDLMYSLAVFGDELAKREKYTAHDGLEALHYYIVQKHNWFPSQVRALNHEDLRFLLAEEMRGWTLPKNARPPK